MGPLKTIPCIVSSDDCDCDTGKQYHNKINLDHQSVYNKVSSKEYLYSWLVVHLMNKTRLHGYNKIFSSNDDDLLWCISCKVQYHNHEKQCLLFFWARMPHENMNNHVPMIMILCRCGVTSYWPLVVRDQKYIIIVLCTDEYWCLYILNYSFGNTLWLLITENFKKVQNLGQGCPF